MSTCPAATGFAPKATPRIRQNSPAEKRSAAGILHGLLRKAGDSIPESFEDPMVSVFNP